MIERMSNRTCLVLIAALAVLSLIARFWLSQAVSALYSNYTFSILNILAGARGQLPLDFYLGRIQETVFGPLNVLASGLAFLIFALRYLENASWKRFSACVFAYLLFAKFEILLFPPYGDSVSGPFVEAMWLSRHHFDYLRLSQETLFIRGGPKVYLFSLYPGFIALGMKLLPGAKVFLAVNHLIIFALSAIIFALFREILRRNYPAKIAMLVTFLFLSLPLVQSQIEQLNMEVPILFFLMLSFYAMTQRKVLLAAVFSALAALVKVYALYAGFAVFLSGIFLYFNDPQRRGNIRVLGASLLALAFVVLGAYALLFVLNPQGTVDKVGLFQGMDQIKKFPISYFFLLSLVVFFMIFVKEKAQGASKFWDRVCRFLFQHETAAFMFLMTTGWFALFSTSAWVPPRYTLILLPSLIIAVFFSLDRLLRGEKRKEIILICLIIFSFLSSFGLVYRPVTVQDHAVVERSLEYRNDVMLHMKIAKTLEQKFSHLTIAAPFTFAQMLAFPEIGYVSKKLDVMIYLFPCLYEGIKNFDGIENMDITRVVWVGVNTPFMRAPYLPMGPSDFILEQLDSGNKSACLFLGGYSVNAVYHQGQAFMKMLKDAGALKANKKIYD